SVRADEGPAHAQRRSALVARGAVRKSQWVRDSGEERGGECLEARLLAATGHDQSRQCGRSQQRLRARRVEAELRSGRAGAGPRIEWPNAAGAGKPVLATLIPLVQLVLHTIPDCLRDAFFGDLDGLRPLCSLPGDSVSEGVRLGCCGPACAAEQGVDRASI